MKYSPSTELDFEDVFQEFSIGCLPCLQPDEDGFPCNEDAKWFNPEEHDHLCDEHVHAAWRYKLKQYRKFIKFWSQDIMHLSLRERDAEVKLVDGTTLEGTVRIDHPDWLTLLLEDQTVTIQRRNILTITPKPVEVSDEDE